jgi:hypothetical protein
MKLAHESKHPQHGKRPVSLAYLPPHYCPRVQRLGGNPNALDEADRMMEGLWKLSHK